MQKVTFELAGRESVLQHTSSLGGGSFGWPQTESQKALGVSCLFLLAGLLSGLGDLAALFGLLDSLDDTDSDGLSHVTNGETSERWVLGE